MNTNMHSNNLQRNFLHDSNTIKTKESRRRLKDYSINQGDMVNVRVRITLFQNVQRCHQIQKTKRAISSYG